MTMIVHLAGPTIRNSHAIRCRCSWCGALIEELDVRRDRHAASYPHDGAGNPAPLWRGFVGIDGDIRVSLPEIGVTLPDEACLMLDMEVTR